MSVEVWFGVRGGVGTTRCVRDRMRAASRAGRIVAIDLDIARGDLADQLGTRPSATIASLASAAPGELLVSDVDSVGESFAHGGGGRIIASPAQPELVDFVDPGLVSELLGLAASTGPVLVDAGSHFDVVALAAFAAADRVVLVARTEPNCARQLGRLLDLCDRAGVRAELRLAVPRASRTAAQRFAASAGLPLMVTGRRVPPWLGSLGARMVGTDDNHPGTAGRTHGAVDVRL